jgi:hypothetical protein
MYGKVDRGCDMHLQEMAPRHSVLVVHSESEQVVRKREDIPIM